MRGSRCRLRGQARPLALNLSDQPLVVEAARGIDAEFFADSVSLGCGQPVHSLRNADGDGYFSSIRATTALNSSSRPWITLRAS